MLRRAPRGSDREGNRGRLGVDKDCLWSILGRSWAVEMLGVPGSQGRRTATRRRSPPRAVSQCTEGIASRLGSGSGAQMQPPGPEPLQLPLGALVPQPQTDGTIHTTSTGISLLEGMCTAMRHHCTQEQSINSQGLQVRHIPKKEECQPSIPILITGQVTQGSWLHIFFVFFLIFFCVASFSVSKRAFWVD